MPDSFDYTTGTNSENVRLLQALIDEAPEYTEETNSRNANILKSIINNTEYTDAPQSEIEELLLRLKAKIGGEIEVDELNVTENGTYDAGVNKAYNPVNVELPLDGKTITANGTYTASDDNLAGYDEVTVAVEGYAKKSIPNTPTPIATFNASALPMPSLTVGIEAVQAGNGDPSPQNVRPISGFSAVNVYRVGDNMGNCADIPEPLTTNKWYPVNLPYDTYTISFDVVNAVRTTVGDTYVFTPYDGTTNTNILASKIYSVEDGSTYQSKGANVSGRFYFTYTGKFQSLGCFWRSNSYQVLTSGSLENIMIEKGANPTKQYTPYNGTTYITTLKDGQGNPMTCYGGELSNVNGVQTLNNGTGIVDLGTLNWIKGNMNTAGTGRIFYVPLTASSPMKQPSDNGLCEALKYNPFSSWPAGQWEKQILNAITVTGSSAVVACAQDIYATASDFKTAMSGIMFAYELATPQQIQQDSLSIATQEGVNNIWADSGDIKSGEYMEAL